MAVIFTVGHRAALTALLRIPTEKSAVSPIGPRAGTRRSRDGHVIGGGALTRTRAPLLAPGHPRGLRLLAAETSVPPQRVRAG